jgi:acyl-coenzyme A synthetase/AMP-(fatty) acid ligase/acyl carrier protein
MHHTSPEALVSIFNVHRVTVAHFVPSMLRMWLQVEGARRCPELRMVLCSGEVLTPDLAAEFHRQSTAELHNLYGPTEASIDVTHFRVDRVLREPTPIGRPITNTNVYILDEDHAVCPVGEIGEIYIQGIGVASGYLEAEESEALQFSPVETSIGPSEWRTFRTGDAGRYTHDGQIEYCGRLDSQVKIRGQRVELAEVEKALRDQSAVLDVCAQAYEGGSGRTCIAAHVVLAANHCLSDPVGALMNYLMRSLPSRSVPTRIVIVSEIPLGSHGKIDRSKLVKPGRKRPDIGNLYRPPETTLETLIAGIWAQILDLDEVGITDDFHQIGGDSLAAVEISFLIAERLELDYDDELISDVLLDGDTVEKSARIAASRGIPDQFV